MSDRIRLALVGAGVAAQAIHVPILERRRDLFRVVAVCDPSPRARTAVAERLGVPARGRHERVEALLDAGGIDAMLVLTSGSHGGICARAAGAGLAVFSEKPLAYTRSEAEVLEPLSGRIALGYMKIYDPAVREAAELLAGRTARSVEVVVLHPPTAAQLRHIALVESDDVTSERRTELEQEEQRLLEQALGPATAHARDLYRWRILGSVVHDLAVLRVLVGEPEKWDRVDVWPEGGLASVSLEGRLRDGGRVSIRWHLLADYPAYREEVRVHDERGTVQVTFPSPYLPSPGATLTVVDRDCGQPRVTERTSTVSPFEEELVAFHRLATAGEPTAAGVAEGRADIEICQGALRSYCELKWMPIGGEALAA
jgi:myo-inositol 2-dehydrogenase/D-chiro-inositol 1-dehydrogenase